MPDLGEATDESLLRLRDARRLVIATFVSFAGAAMASVAIAFVAYQRSSSLVLTVLVLAARALPSLFLAPLVGRLTRRDPRIVGALGQAGNLVLALGLAALAAVGDLDYGLLLVYSVANGVVCALIAPTIPTYNRMVVPDDRLAEFTALWSGVAAVASIPGALVGGVVVATAGPEWTFLAYAVSYVPLLVVILTLPKPAHQESDESQTLRAGIDAVRRHALLRRALGLAAVLNLVAWPVLSVLPALASEIDPRAHILGYLTGAFFAGSALSRG